LFSSECENDRARGSNELRVRHSDAQRYPSSVVQTALKSTHAPQTSIFLQIYLIGDAMDGLQGTDPKAAFRVSEADIQVCRT
jgi:hypothetical protein